MQNRLDIASGLMLVLLALALHFYLIPNFVEDSEFGAMSPQFFPELGALIIGAGGVLMVITAAISIKRSVAASSALSEENGSFWNVILIIAAMSGFILLFQWFGYFYAAPPLIFALMILFGARNPLVILATAAITTVFLFLVFSYGLNLPLA